MTPTPNNPELPNEEAFSRVGEILSSGLAHIMGDPGHMAQMIQTAKIMQTALTVDGEWTEPIMGLKVSLDAEGNLNIMIPAKFVQMFPKQ